MTHLEHSQKLNERYFNKLETLAVKLDMYTEMAKSYITMDKMEDPNFTELMSIAKTTYNRIEQLKCVNALPISLS